jgi:uncharacterized protein (TIGR02246 family)
MTNTREAPSAETTQEQFEKIAKENFVIWNKALLSKNPHKVAELYSEKNTFLPTVSDEYKKGRQAAEGYFHHFQEKNPEGKIITDKVIPISADTYLHSGKYDFEVDTSDKKGREIVHADFTYVWGKNQSGEWQIIHHHSSAKSETKITQNFLQGKISEEEVQKLSPDTYLRSGLYTYTIETEEGPKNIEARFTSLWKKDELVYQHLSEKPKV